MPEQTVRAAAGARHACANSSRTRSRPIRAAEIVERILRHRERDRAAARRLGGAGGGRDGLRRARPHRRRSGLPTLVLHGTADAVVDSAQQRAARAPRSRTRSVELFPGAGHLFFWEQPERFVAELSRSFSCELADARSAGSATARARRRRASRSTAAASETTYARARRALRAARRRPARGRARTRRPRRDADGHEHRARRRLLRLREGGPDPDAAEHPPRAARSSPTSSRTRSPPCCSAPTSTPRRPPRSTRAPRGLEELVADRATSSLAPPGRRRRAAARLHLGHDRQAEGRAAHARQLLLDEPLLRPGRRASPVRTRCCRCCRSSTSAAGTCRRCSPGGRARPSCSSRRSTRRGRSR